MSNNYNQLLVEEEMIGTGGGDGGAAVVEVEAATGDNGTIAVLPSLPSDAMGVILSHLPMADVKSSLLAGRITTSDALRKVTTVNLFRLEDLDVGVAVRFKNATNVNIFCLLECHVPNFDPGNGGDMITKMSTDALTRIVPALESFPRLERAFVGGYVNSCDGWCVGSS